MVNFFTNDDSYHERFKETSKILKKYPERIPIIVEKSSRTFLPELDKRKFLVPNNMILGQFKYIIHKYLFEKNTLNKSETLYLFINNKVLKTDILISELYELYKNKDGYLYIYYSAENTLG
tara:strand:+ start:57 stop:419 length:363 start_codon:yes stop_codon:yes gene_type:complete